MLNVQARLLLGLRGTLLALQEGRPLLLLLRLHAHPLWLHACTIGQPRKLHITMQHVRAVPTILSGWAVRTWYTHNDRWVPVQLFPMNHLLAYISSMIFKFHADPC